MTPLVIVGGGGHATVLFDLTRALGTVQVVGYAAPEDSALSTLGVERVGSDDCAEALRARGIVDVALGLAGSRDNVHRRELFAQWKRNGFRFMTLIHPLALVSSYATFKEGLQCLPMAIVNARATLGENVIVNTRALVEHDCVVGDHAHIGPGVVLCGGVRVGAGALIGAGATVIPGVRIGSDALVAAGSVVTRDVPAGARMAGVPAGPMRMTGTEVR
jgi:sugar O-acyltransferase (sialic acid O-acetyltransferase NeuD family)